ncbi:hypothetical protein Pen01_02910 [Phytomonospora endophytica]|nr:hypothetical protein Pen01_02910 [Phytomonospora endophytica]
MSGTCGDRSEGYLFARFNDTGLCIRCRRSLSIRMCGVGVRAGRDASGRHLCRSVDGELGPELRDLAWDELAHDDER